MASRAKTSDKQSESPRSDRTALPIDSRSRIAVRVVLAIALVALAAFIATGFLPALAWAAVIAITTWPAYLRFAALFPERRAAVLAPLLFTLITCIVLLMPLMLALHQLAQASDAFMGWLAQLRDSGAPVPAWTTQLPFAADLVTDWWKANLVDPQDAARWLGGLNMESLTSWTRALGGELLSRLFQFLVMLIALFFMFRDGGWLAERAVDTADRLLGDPGERLAGKLTDAVRGTVNGTVVIAVAEGIIIGVGYHIAGASDALLLTLLTIAFAMLPLGAELAVTFVALLMLVQGAGFLTVLALFAFGLAVTIIGDNFVWPALVGRTARLPFLLALIGVLGGVQTFGLIGLFIGPVIMAVMLTIWREWIAPE
jgi:predicted PurR-regulated permease PerM